MGATGSSHECFANAPDFVSRQSGGWKLLVLERNRGRPHRLPATSIFRRKLRAAVPWNVGRGFSACVIQLDADWHIEALSNALQDPAHGSFRLVTPKANVAVGDAPFR